MMHVLLAETTSADQSTPFAVRQSATGAERALVVVTNLAGAEKATLQVSYDGGTSWVDYAADGVVKEADSTNNVIEVSFPGTYRVDKDATVGNSGIYLALGQVV